MTTTSATKGVLTLHLIDGDRDMPCTLKAALAMTREFGGLAPAITALSTFDAQALGKAARIATGAKDAPALEDSLFKTGYARAAPELVKWITAMMNGGVPPEDGEEDAEGNG